MTASMKEKIFESVVINEMAALAAAYQLEKRLKKSGERKAAAAPTVERKARQHSKKKKAAYQRSAAGSCK